MAEKQKTSVQDRERDLLWQKCLQHPLQIGSYAQFSDHLIKDVATYAQTHHRNDFSELKIVNVNASTGKMAEFLLDVGVFPQNLCLVEPDDEIYTFLKSRFSASLDDDHILHCDAYGLLENIPTNWIGDVDLIISNAPLFLHQFAMRREIIETYFQCLKPAGSILQMTYGHISPIHSLTWVKQEKVVSLWGHLPPVFVWNYYKDNTHHQESAA